jgi:hypothetical protein
MPARSRQLLWGLLGLVGCNAQTHVRLSIAAAPGVTLRTLYVQVQFPDVDGDEAWPVPATGSAPLLPGDTDLLLPDHSGQVKLALFGDDMLGRTLAASTTGQVSAHGEARASVTLGAGYAASCNDQMRGGDESDVDCGGSCPACRAGALCATAADCATGNCYAGRCAPATGPPGWLPAAPMPTPRLGLAAVTAPDGHVYALGGSTTGTNDYLTTVEVYDPKADQWSSAPSLSTPHFRTAAALGSDKRIYVAGGYGGFAVVESLAAGDPSWSAAPPLPAGRAYLALAVGSGGLYALGGNYPGFPDIAPVVSLNPGQAMWQNATMLPTPRSNLGAATAADGTIYVAGGHDAADTTYFDELDAYDPASGSWSTLAPMLAKRSDVGAAIGGDGRLYVLGGYNGSTGQTTAMAYQTDVDAWAPVTSLTYPRDAAAATVLDDRRILVLGGRMPSASPGTATVEIYGPVLSLDPPTGAGQPAMVRATNFAAQARLRVGFDGTVVAATATDGQGSARVSLRVPAGAASGTHIVEATDDKSRYTVRARLTLP